MTDYQRRILEDMARGRTLMSWGKDGGSHARMDSLTHGAPIRVVRVASVRALERRGLIVVYCLSGQRVRYTLTDEGIIAVADVLRRKKERTDEQVQD